MKKIKKRKFSLKKTLKLLVPLFIIIIILVNARNIVTFWQSKITGYEFETIRTFYELDIYDDVKKHTHSETLEHIITTEYYNPKYLDSYLDIDYYDRDNYFIRINRLLDNGYNTDEINEIYRDLNDESIEILTNYDYLEDICNILNLAYFDEDKLKRYLEYIKDKDLGYEDLVTYVNANLDNKYYIHYLKAYLSE